MVKNLMLSLLFISISPAICGFDTSNSLNKKFFETYTDKIIKESTCSPIVSGTIYGRNDSIQSIANFINGISIFLPDSLTISSFNLGEMSKLDATVLKFWCDNNYKYLSWGLIDDAMNLSLFEYINGKLYPVERSRLKARFNLRKLNDTHIEITDFEMEEYLVSHMTEIGELFTVSSSGYVESVRLNLYNCAFLYAIGKYNSHPFFNENTGIITRCEFQDICDWCYLNSSILKLSEIRRLESTYINQQMMEF